MTAWLLVLTCVLAAYLLGSIPWPYLVVRALRGIDIRSVGDGNMGTQNVWQAVGPAASQSGTKKRGKTRRSDLTSLLEYRYVRAS